MVNIILASASPRRRELLNQVGCQFSVITSDVVEDNTLDMSPSELVSLQAKDKALDVAAKIAPESVVIGADTIVALDGQVFGKPENKEDARCMLRRLAGKEHEVITGVAVVRGTKVWVEHVITKVRIKNLADEEIDHYIATGEPMDKAGAYGIQGIGALLVEEISGCYANVVGLPLQRLSQMLKKAGVQLL